MSETAGIGEKGNCVLCGHNGSRNGTFFTNLNQISISDEVKILDKKGEWHRYEVKETFIIGPRDNSVKNQSGEEILTLLTCANRGTQRFICVCTPIKQNDRKKQAGEVFEMSAYVDMLENKLDQMTHELVEMRKELREMKEEQASKTLKETLSEMVDRAEILSVTL